MTQQVWPEHKENIAEQMCKKVAELHIQNSPMSLFFINRGYALF
jgi:hypothetical protein